MLGRVLLVALAACAVAGSAAGQFASPPPPALRANSGTPLAETFTPDTLFPKKPDPTPPPPPPAALDDGPACDGLFPTPPPPPKLWSGGADLGINGAAGNSELLTMRAGWNVRRKVERNAFTSDFQYVYSRQTREVKAHQALYNARDEVLFPGSPWSAFAASQVEYDQLRAYRFRVGVYAGAAYAVTDTPDVVLKLRAGAGATREFGSGLTADRWVPEFLFGYDFRYRLTEQGTFVSILDYYPRVSDPRQFRVRARAAFEYVLDPKTGTVVRVGVQDRYDSDPGDAKRNDMAYFTTLGFKF
jgi:hypothetical protein